MKSATCSPPSANLRNRQFQNALRRTDRRQSRTALSDVKQPLSQNRYITPSARVARASGRERAWPVGSYPLGDDHSNAIVGGT